jgi:hypothetical protein
LKIKRVLGPEWKYFPKRSYSSGGIAAWVKGWAGMRIAASVINVWMPLDAVGTDLPSLEIVLWSHTAMRRVAVVAS